MANIRRQCSFLCRFKYVQYVDMKFDLQQKTHIVHTTIVLKWRHRIFFHFGIPVLYVFVYTKIRVSDMILCMSDDYLVQKNWIA